MVDFNKILKYNISIIFNFYYDLCKSKYNINQNQNNNNKIIKI